MSESDNKGSSRVRRGFGAMDPEKQREIARMGARAVTEKGTRHKWTPEKASEAGRKGGLAAAARKKREAEEAAADA